jgi:hypothetical protein
LEVHTKAVALLSNSIPNNRQKFIVSHKLLTKEDEGEGDVQFISGLETRGTRGTRRTREIRETRETRETRGTRGTRGTRRTRGRT